MNFTQVASYVHPLFWITSADGSMRFVHHRATHGQPRGPVAFTQIDNELPGLHLWPARWTTTWSRWVSGRATDGGRDGCSNATGHCGAQQELETNYARFEDARPIAPGPTEKANELRHIKDYFEFYFSTVADYAETLVEMMRQHGIDTPIVHNSAGRE